MPAHLPAGLRRTTASLFVLSVLGISLIACGEDDDGTGGGGTSIAVEAGDDRCTAERTELTAGDVTFDVTNVGGDVTEVYVYGESGSGAYDRIIGEVENIAPQTSRDFPVSLSAGDYELACKPGQVGDGIRTKLTVSGAGGSPAAGAATEPAYDREVEIEATDYAFSGLAGFTGKTGEVIEFKLENAGSNEHEFELFAPSGDEIAGIDPVTPGETGEVIVELEEEGTYRFICGVGDHEDRGMKGNFEVSAA